MISDEQVQKIATALQERGIESTCPMCDKKEEMVLNQGGFVIQVLREEVNVIKDERNSMPCIALICPNCGYVRMHAVGALGLIEEL